MTSPAKRTPHTPSVISDFDSAETSEALESCLLTVGELILKPPKAP